MTDHRVTDLSYGHLGKACYDTKENKWTFSKVPGQEISIQQLLAPRECIPPSSQDAPEEIETPSVVRQRQLTSLLRAQPEIYPADPLIATLSKISSVEKNNLHNHSSTLFAIGRAIDANRVAGSERLSSRRPRIFALPCGAAGHILQLALPRREIRAWGRRSGARLSMLDAFSLEKGFWISTGGPIYQITFSDDENGSGTWLAVRQAAVITIFRPLYGRLHKPPSTSYSSEAFPASLLNPNPVAALTSKKMDSGGHADLSFNPWYSRQFAVVDSHGQWEIYDLQRLHDKDGLERISANNSGKMYDDEDSEKSLKRPVAGHSDGWYRILWVCNLHTIIVSNRRHLALFDIKSKSTIIYTMKFIATISSDWILDIKLSLTDKNCVFVLTTSRIYWVQVNPMPDKSKDNLVGMKILLSYLHFRDPSDQTMKLTLLKDDYLSILITSLKSPLVNAYYFWNSIEGSGIPCGRQSSFFFHSDSNERNAIQTACLTHCILSSFSINPAFGPETQYLERGINFYQLWILNPNLSLSVTLCAVTTLDSGRALDTALDIRAPDTRVLKPSRHSERRAINVSFIVPDGIDDEEEISYNRSIIQQQDLVPSAGRDSTRLRLDWRRLFRVIWQTPPQSHVLGKDDLPGISEILIHMSEQLRHRMDGELLTCSTIGEISGLSQMKGDLDRAAPVLQDFLGSLIRNQNIDGPSILVLSNLTACPSLDIPLNETSGYPDLLRTYDQLVEQWMSNLPLKLSGRSRGSKFKIIRQLAIDLCFNSIGLSLQNKIAVASLEPVGAQELSTEKCDATTRESSPSLLSSQLASIPERETDFHLLTPVRTPSLYSQATSGSALREDAAIIRLRQYVPSITAKTAFEKPALLSHWPSLHGTDPSLYSYELAQRASALLESGDEGDHRSHREQARRRKRTEKFLQQERSRAVEAASQAAAMPSGSQPEASCEPFSSQAAENVPMTQSDRGVFGSRLVHPVKKKKKRAAGFR